VSGHTPATPQILLGEVGSERTLAAKRGFGAAVGPQGEPERGLSGASAGEPRHPHQDVGVILELQYG
jgi:hypothetical protein